MKIIFLDLDGVINDYLTFDKVNPSNVNILKEIIEKTNAQIVLTSSHKYPLQENPRYQKDYKKYLLKIKYLKELQEMKIEVVDIIPYVNRNREEEIQAYLEKHQEIKEYLILDDDFLIKSCQEHEIYLDLASGLRAEHIKPALNILNGNLGLYSDNPDIEESPSQRCLRMNLKIQEKI